MRCRFWIEDRMPLGLNEGGEPEHGLTVRSLGAADVGPLRVGDTVLADPRRGPSSPIPCDVIRVVLGLTDPPVQFVLLRPSADDPADVAAGLFGVEAFAEIVLRTTPEAKLGFRLLLDPVSGLAEEKKSS